MCSHHDCRQGTVRKSLRMRGIMGWKKHGVILKRPKPVTKGSGRVLKNENIIVMFRQKLSENIHSKRAMIHVPLKHLQVVIRGPKMQSIIRHLLIRPVGAGLVQVPLVFLIVACRAYIIPLYIATMLTLGSALRPLCQWTRCCGVSGIALMTKTSAVLCRVSGLATMRAAKDGHVKCSDRMRLEVQNQQPQT